MSSESSAVNIVRSLEGVYQNFTDEVKKLGSKAGRGKLGTSVVHWIAGSHVKTQRDVMCDKFFEDITSALKLLDESLQYADEEETREACDMLADILSATVPANSNSTTDLMKRAMLGQLKPYLPKISEGKLLEVKKRIEAAYSRWQRLPVEQDMLKEIDSYLK